VTAINGRTSTGNLNTNPNSGPSFNDAIANNPGFYGWVVKGAATPTDCNGGSTANLACIYYNSNTPISTHSIMTLSPLTSGDLGLLGNGMNANTVRQDAFFGVFDGTLTATDEANLRAIVSNFVNSW
jgi:hypothetical protein